MNEITAWHSLQCTCMKQNSITNLSTILFTYPEIMSPRKGKGKGKGKVVPVL
jgi:hypothetical protein